MMIAILVISNFAFAAPTKAERELSPAKAKEIMETKDQAAKEKYLGKIADLAGQAGNVNGLSLNIKKALLQGDADLLILVYKATAKKDEATLKFIAEASGGVKTVTEARTIARLALMENAGSFRAELTKLVEGGKSITEAFPLASAALKKLGVNEITIEKILSCLV